MSSFAWALRRRLAEHLPPSQAGDELARELQDHVRHETAPYEYPRIVEFVRCRA